MPAAFPAPVTSMAPVTPTQGSACAATTPRAHHVSAACQVSTATPSQARPTTASPAPALDNRPARPSQTAEKWCVPTARRAREGGAVRSVMTAFSGTHWGSLGAPSPASHVSAVETWTPTLWATVTPCLAAACDACTTRPVSTASTVRKASTGTPWPLGLQTNACPAAATRRAQPVSRDPATQRPASAPACPM